MSIIVILFNFYTFSDLKDASVSNYTDFLLMRMMITLFFNIILISDQLYKVRNINGTY